MQICRPGIHIQHVHPIPEKWVTEKWVPEEWGKALAGAVLVAAAIAGLTAAGPELVSMLPLLAAVIAFGILGLGVLLAVASFLGLGLHVVFCLRRQPR